MAKKSMIIDVTPGGPVRAIATSPARSVRAQVKAEQTRAQLEIIKAIVSDPLLLGLAALAGNELAYRAGLYDPRKGEASESILGGPTWITIGPSLPPAQQKRNLINGFIIGVTTARAIAPAMPAIIAAGSTAAKALATVA